MKDKLKLLILLLGIFILPANVLAYPMANEVGNSEKANVITDNGGKCPAGSICRNQFFGGVRITYVDQNGKAVSSSFDFVSNKDGDRNIIANNLNGDKSKVGGSQSFGDNSISNYPTFSDLVNSFNSNCSGQSCKSAGYTMHYDFNFKQEQEWFNSLTKSNLSSEQFTSNINAIGKAIESIYPGNFNAEAMQMMMSDSCNTGQEIYIQIEPLFMTYYGDYGERVFGSVRDQANYYEQNYQKGEKLLSKYNGWGFGKLVYYDDSINNAFDGYQKSNGREQLTSMADLDAGIGVGAALDWASNSEKYCNGCTFKDGEFKYDDKPVEASSYSGKFSSLYEYAFTSGDAGGMNCCGQVSQAVNGNSSSLPADMKEYYDFYCNLKGDPCTEQEFSTLSKKVYFCSNGKECSADQYQKECDPPPPCEEDQGDDPGNKCCTEDPIEPGKITGDINNCCDPNTESEASEYNLDDLFCNNDYLGVNNYQTKCGAEFYYQDGQNIEQTYCNMFCTERISVEIPGPITAISGRYFKLTKTQKGGTSSSYIEGYKRCRIRIAYDQWEKDYYDIVEDQRDSYNSFQENKGYQRLYEKAEKEVISNQKETSSISCSCTCTYPDTCGSGKNKYSCTKTATATDSGSCDIEFNKYPFKQMFDINPVQIDEDKRSACYNIYNAIEFKKDDSYKTEHNDWSSWEIDPSIAKCDQKTASMQVYKSAGPCGCTLSCSRSTTEAETRREDVHTVRANYNAKADSDNQSYNGYADEAKEMEDIIDRCDKYFTDYEGAEAEKNYQLNSTQNFYYSQVYMDEYGGLKIDDIYVDFENTPGCQTDQKVTTGADGEDHLAANQYSTKYGSGNEKMTDFKNTTLDYEKTSTGFQKYRDTPYDADKIFTTDAKYHATCYWNEGENTLYTLVPNGAAETYHEEYNYTEHNQEYKVYLTTLEGTYQTYWELAGLGTPRKGEEPVGRFDRYFKENGNLCSGKSADGYTTLSCKLRVDHEVVLTGYCNGTAVDDPDDCDPYKEGYRLFNFKVVDAANLFPSGVNTVDGAIAYNWTSTPLGQQALTQIQAAGVSGKTFAPENLSYSYILTPTDMAEIKQYNAQQISSGGYSDFTLVCSNCERGACDQCKSDFLLDIANGNLQYYGSNHKMSGWANKDKDITAVRRSYGWN